ncbi:MAG TPA: hypothetical protein VHK67_03625 [Rhabdochlamydiaceae bacterium]|jgi:hypothetical protein|nr:hypothetical protein [Rhabdochlamydiaceae bacterium]
MTTPSLYACDVTGLLLRCLPLLTFPKHLYEATIGDLESRKTNNAPFSKIPVFQDELNKAHVTYQRYLQTTIDTFKAISAINEELRALPTHDIGVVSALVEIESRLNSLIDKINVDRVEMGKLEAKIAGLTS